MDLSTVKNISIGPKEVERITDETGRIVYWRKGYWVTVRAYTGTYVSLKNSIVEGKDGPWYIGDVVHINAPEIQMDSDTGEAIYFKRWWDGDRNRTNKEIVISNINDFIAYYKEPQTIYYIVVTSSNNNSMGTASPSRSNVAAGNSITITATTNNGYRFLYWKDGNTTISTNSSYTFTPTRNISLLAYFDYDSSWADVTLMGSNCSLSGSGRFQKGTTHTVQCITADGYTFTGWYKNNVLVSTNARYTFTVTEDITLTASCVDYDTLTINVEGAGTVTGAGNYNTGNVVHCTATPSESSGAFVGWYLNDQLLSTDTEYSFTIIEDTTLRAVFTSSGNTLVNVSNLNPETIISYGWSNISDSSKYGLLVIGKNEIPSGENRIYFSYQNVPRGASCRITFTDKDGNVTQYTASNSTIYNITGYTDIVFDVYMPA